MTLGQFMPSVKNNRYHEKLTSFGRGIAINVKREIPQHAIRNILRLLPVPGLAILLAFTLLAGLAAQTPPTNLLTDPGFESGTTDHWTASPGTTQFSITQTHVFSGQFAAAVGSDGSTSTKAMVQTVPISGGTDYLLAGMVLKNDPAAKLARLRVGWYAADGCAGSQLSTADTPKLTADSPDFAPLAATVTAPATARCAEIRAQIQPLDSRPAVVFFDDILFASAPVIPPTPTPVPAPPVALKITEALYDALTPSTSGDEFVEICNPTTTDAALDGYKIGDEETPGKGEGMYRFPVTATLAVDACAVVAKNAAQFRTRFGFLPDFEAMVSGSGYTDTLTVPNLARFSAWGKGSWALANTGDEVLLLAPDDTVLDAVAYGNGDYGAVGVEPALTAPAPFSLQRVSPTADTDSMPLDFFRDNPTPGAAPILPAPPLVPSAPAIAGGMFAFFGAVAGETTLGGGDAPPALTLAHARNAGLQFAALTDPAETLSPRHWQATQFAADTLSAPGEFIALAGFSAATDTVSILGVDAPLTATVSVSGAMEFLADHPAAIGQIAFLPDPTVLPTDTIRLMPLNSPAAPETFDTAALESAWAQGWHVAPTAFVPLGAPRWGTNISARMGIIAPELSREAVLDALRSRRVFAATADGLALAARFGGRWMGSADVPPGESAAAVFVRGEPSVSGTVTIFDGDVPLKTMAVSALPFSATETIVLRPGHFYWAQLQTVAGNIAVIAPVWVSGSPQPDEIWLNEVLPAPKAHDWDGDGTADSTDEWVELFNPNDFPVAVGGWTLGDRTEKRYTLPAGSILASGGARVIYRAASAIALNNGGDDVLLARPDGMVADSMTFTESPGDDLSVCRVPDTGEWASPCRPTPNAANIVLPPPAPLSLDIWHAKHVTEGAWIRVTGYVTVLPGVFGKNTFYLEDETHGIRIKLPSGHGLWFAIGDRLEVTGFLNLYYNEWEIDVRQKSDVQRLDGSRLLPPLPVDSGMLREGYEGLLVQVTATPLAFKKGSTSFFADDGTGLVYVYIPRGSGIHRADVMLGAPLTIVGIAGQRTRSHPPRDGYRLMPRAPFDLVAQSPPPAAPAGFPSVLPATGFAPGK